MRLALFLSALIGLVVAAYIALNASGPSAMCGQEQVASEAGVTAWRRDCGATTGYSLVLVAGTEFPERIDSPAVIAVTDFPERFEISAARDAVVLRLPDSADVFSQTPRFSSEGNERRLVIEQF
ncbi:hypothetical protein [Euryhalocaulis caribicus]|uniref:hypothetical protein n=1 Tax=Euryhalocaulis caribicus TaxID=1161401 RepID=UPI0003B60BEB|nr:hypothetical protein [Euryhalocaulis caribicus]